MEFEEENNELGKSFLQNMYFHYWEENERDGNHNRIELQSSYECNLNCKYCYVDRHRDELYNEVDDETLYKNAEMLIEWLIENDYNPSIDYFGGEVFVKDINFEILNMILEKFKEIDNKPPQIIIPTNMTWIKSDELTEKVEKLLKKSREYNIPIKLSASIDGKYCTENRPPVNFTDEEYDKLFDFCKKWKVGFHPMIYSEEIENWKDNWKWFQEKFREYDIPFNNIYLLEVRNREWNEKQLNEFSQFLEWLIDWTIEKSDNFVDSIFDSGYNILRNLFSSNSRGMGCSIQSSLFVRMSDLTLNMCHRTSYDQFELGEFVVEDGIKDIKINRPELLIGHKTLNNDYYPVCEDCLINKLCTGQCLGASYEYMGDLYTPIPNVCRLEHIKVYTIIRKIKDEGYLEDIKKVIKEENVRQIEKMEELI